MADHNNSIDYSKRVILDQQALHAVQSFHKVIGTPFYLMEYLPGRVLKDPSLPSMTPTERKV